MSALTDEIKTAVREVLREEVRQLLVEMRPAPTSTTGAASELAVSVARAAELSGYTHETILARINEGQLHATKPGGSREWRILVDDLRRWLASESSEKVVLDNKSEARKIVAGLAASRGR